MSRCHSALRSSVWFALLFCSLWRLSLSHAQSPDQPGPVLVPPERIAGDDPQYPDAAGSAAGVVRLRLSVSAQGEVTEVELVSSPSELLTEPAVRAARTLRFKPATRDGQPVAARILYELAFEPPPLAAAEDAAGTPDASGALQPTAADGEALAADAAQTIDATGDSAAGAPEHFDVVVTGSRAPEEQNQAVVFTDVIGRRAIQQSGARDAADALEHASSLQLTRTFLGTEIYLRGLDPQYTLVLLDGDRMIGRQGGAIDLTRIGVERIERIEVVRGPASALYGSDALAGVVNIIGAPPSGQAHGRALLEGGFTPKDNGLLDATLWATQPVAKGLDVQASAGVHTAPAVKDDGEETTGLSGRRQWSLFGAARYQPTKVHEIKTSGEYDRQRLNGVDEGAGGALYDRTQLREQGVGALSYRMRPSETIDWNTRYRYSYFREQYLRDQRGSTAMDSIEDNREQLHQASSMVTWQPTAAHALTVGAEELVQRLRAPRLTSTGQRNSTSVFAQHRFRPWQREHPERIECDQQLSIVPGLRLDADSQFGSQLSPKLALRYDPAPCFTLRASYGRGFRAPSFQQLLLRFENPSVGYVVLGNPNLTAERSHGVDVSASWMPLPVLTAMLAVFRNDLSDMITTVSAGDSASGTTFTYANVARAWTMGFEASLRWDATAWLACDLSYTYTGGRNVQLDRPLENIARHRPAATLRYHHDAWGTVARFRGSAQLGRVFFTEDDSMPTESDGSRRIDAKPLVTGDIRVEQRVSDNFEAFVGIENLFNAADAYAALRPRTYYAGLSGHY